MKKVSFTRQSTDVDWYNSAKTGVANKNKPPMWGLGERSSSMNQSSFFIRESPDLFRHSPASVLNQQRRHQLFVTQHRSTISYSGEEPNSHTQSYSASSSERTDTPIPIQDYSESILKQIENAKTLSRNGLNTHSNLASIDTNHLKRSWDSIYHHSVGPGFRYIEATKPTTRINTTSPRNIYSSQMQGNLSAGYESERNKPSHHLPNIKQCQKHKKKKQQGLLRRVAQKQDTDLKMEFPAVRVSFRSGDDDEEDESDSDDDENNEYGKLLRSLKHRNQSVRLQPNEINMLRVNPKAARSVRSYFFNPKCYSFTPMNTDEKFVKKYPSHQKWSFNSMI